MNIMKYLRSSLVIQSKTDILINESVLVASCRTLMILFLWLNQRNTSNISSSKEKAALIGNENVNRKTTSSSWKIRQKEKWNTYPTGLHTLCSLYCSQRDENSLFFFFSILLLHLRQAPAVSASLYSVGTLIKVHHTTNWIKTLHN